MHALGLPPPPPAAAAAQQRAAPLPRPQLAARDQPPMSSSRTERIESLRKRVAADPYDAAAWEDLVTEADRAR